MSAGDDVEVLRNRILLLERELDDARRLALSPKISTESIEQHQRNHHTSANLAQFGPTDNLVFVDPKKEHAGELVHKHVSPSKLHMFFHNYNFTEFAKRPILHQWMQNGRLHREARERNSSRFELFFDLVFVGIVHQLAESTAERPTGLGLAKFTLTFCPAFSIWSDVRDLGNQFGNDDMTQRLYFLWIMILLVGFSNNASTIELRPISEGLSHESDIALRWAIGFIVVAKLSKALLKTLYGFFLPLSRNPLLVIAAHALLYALFFSIAIVVRGPAFYGLITAAIVGEYVCKVVAVVLMKWFERRRYRQGQTHSSTGSTFSSSDNSDVVVDGSQQTELELARRKYRIPAVNIEHHVERLGAFVTIVLGEMVANVFFSTDMAGGLNAQCGRSILGLMVAFNLNWIYFDSEACKCFMHALRRHWLTGLLFTTLHLPLSLSLLLASAAIKRLVIGDAVAEDAAANTSGDPTIHAVVGGHTGDVAAGIYWFFGAGVGLSLIVMASIGLLHRSLDIAGRGGVLRINRPVVIGTRYAMGVLMILLPLAGKQLGPTRMLGVYVAITAFVIIEETFSRLERVQREDEELMDAVEKAAA